MHQKNSQESSGFGQYNGFDEEEDEEGHNATDPFADDDDDLDDDLDSDEPQQTDSRGGWWRGVVGSAPGTGDNDDSDDEFGDFAMAEEGKSNNNNNNNNGSNDDGTPEKLLLKPLAVNPMKEAARGLSGLWPFASRAETKPDDEGEVVVPAAGEADEQTGKGKGPVEAKEGIRRTSIEEVDDEEEVVNVSGAK